MTTRLRAAALAALALLAGCGGSGSVTGKVTLDGQPLTSGTVTFHPTGSGPVAIGSIGPDGQYQLLLGTDRSVPAGEYVVTVEAAEPIPAESAPAKGPLKPPAAPKRLTPDKYADKDATDLRATVKSGTNKIDLGLKKG